MAVYKVIQDIESEDKIVGFLTLKTFVYALIAGALIYINIRMLMASVLGPLRFVFVFLLFWPMALFGVLAAPIGREQPTETWILAHVRFFLKPRVRLWNQSGLLELVTVTAPKRIERQLTKDLTQREVRSRLKALATTLDSRGWAVRNVAVDLSANPSYLDITAPESDRLAEGSNLPKGQSATDVQEADDIMDAQNNPTAQHFEALMQQEDERRKKQVSEMITTAKQEAKKETQATPKQEDEEAEPPADYSFLDKIEPKDNKGGKETTSFVSHDVITPGAKAEEKPGTEEKDPDLAAAEQEFFEKERKKSEEVHAHAAGFKPKNHAEPEAEVKEEAVKQAVEQIPEAGAKPVQEQSMTKPTQNANLEELAQSGSAFSVATVQKLANRDSVNVKQIGSNEVEIDLHGH
jgi:hypothetical protein